MIHAKDIGIGGGIKMPQEHDVSEFTFLKKEYEATQARNASLEKENQELRQEVIRLKAQVTSLKAHDNERKSILWKKIQNSIDHDYSHSNASQQKPPSLTNLTEQKLGVDNSRSRPDSAAKEEKADKVPKPPPKPVPLPPSLKQMNGKQLPPAPLPPPPPSTKPSGVTRAVRRVPEVVELYRSLTRKDVHVGNKTSVPGTPVVAFTKNMIGEIENRSTYISAIKSEVERQGQFINYLIKEVECATFKDISEVEAFIKWLDEELSSLVDERAVLKHFPRWPERKADTMREAACSYRELRNLESEVSSFMDNPKMPLMHALRRMQALQDRLERSISNVERTRESTSKKYKDFQIPWQWMLDTGLIGQLKLSSLRLAKEYMNRIVAELRSNECFEEDNLLLQGIRFAYRVHQFAGGFDGMAIEAFEELKKACLSYRQSSSADSC